MAAFGDRAEGEGGVNGCREGSVCTCVRGGKNVDLWEGKLRTRREGDWRVLESL